VQAATDAPDPNFVEYPTLQSERAHHGAIISIGPKTDCILDLLELGDQIIPHLRHLIRTTRSGNWVIELQKKEWGLTGRRDAQMISEALLADVKALELARPVRATNPASPFTNLKIDNTHSVLCPFEL
jgi:hypothetical protein